MKKIFMLVLTLFFSLFLFAETGYKGVDWGLHEREITKKLSVNPIFEDNSSENELLKYFFPTFTEKVNETVILGKKVKVSYMFVSIDNEYYLCNVAYIINSDKIKELQNHLKQVRWYKSRFQVEQAMKMLVIDAPNMKQEFDDSIARHYFTDYTMSYKYQGESYIMDSVLAFEQPTKKNKKASGTLTLYDYNDDTRVYIYDNIIKDKAVVVYVPHEQDY